MAFDLSDAARQEARRRADALRPALPPARWVDLAGAHLTLVFLGEVPEERVPPLTERLAAAFAGPVGEPWTAAHGTLFQSRLSPQGARYTPVAELPLEGAA